MFIGYSKASTYDQNPNLQEDALKKAGCEKIFSDRISSTVSAGPKLASVKDKLRKCATLIV